MIAWCSTCQKYLFGNVENQSETEPWKLVENVILKRDSWENSVQRKYPGACGSCVYSGAPGYCSNFLDEKGWATKCRPGCCGLYIANSDTFERLRLMQQYGLETGDAFTINKHVGE